MIVQLSLHQSAIVNNLITMPIHNCIEPKTRLHFLRLLIVQSLNFKQSKNWAINFYSFNDTALVVCRKQTFSSRFLPTEFHLNDEIIVENEIFTFIRLMISDSLNQFKEFCIENPSRIKAKDTRNGNSSKQ